MSPETQGQSSSVREFAFKIEGNHAPFLFIMPIILYMLSPYNKRQKSLQTMQQFNMEVFYLLTACMTAYDHKAYELCLL